MRINSRGCDAETLVEFTAQLTAAGYWKLFESRIEALNSLYDSVRTFQAEHPALDVEDYWQEVDDRCTEILAKLRAER